MAPLKNLTPFCPPILKEVGTSGASVVLADVATPLTYNLVTPELRNITI
jgi:hypothetical protein